MNVGDARRAAVAWVSEEGIQIPGFRGAYFIGSTVTRGDDEQLPEGSDVDVAVVVSAPGAGFKPWVKPGKMVYRGALLEISVFGSQLLSSAEQVLSSYHLAEGLRRDTLIADPSGDLSRLQQQVARDFSKEFWVRCRARDAVHKVERNVANIDQLRHRGTTR